MQSRNYVYIFGLIGIIVFVVLLAFLFNPTRITEAPDPTEEALANQVESGEVLEPVDDADTEMPDESALAGDGGQEEAGDGVAESVSDALGEASSEASDSPSAVEDGSPEAAGEDATPGEDSLTEGDIVGSGGEGPRQEVRVHIVQVGESLSAIAGEYGLSWPDLAAFNGIADPNNVTAGDLMLIPPTSGVGGGESAGDESAASAAGDSTPDDGATGDSAAGDGDLTAGEFTVPTIGEIISGDVNFEILAELLAAVEMDAGLADATAGLITLFAPTDAAFEALPEGVLAALQGDSGSQLQALLQAHMFDGELPINELVTDDQISMLSGEVITVTVTADGIILQEDVSVLLADIELSNGIIHVVDGVLAFNQDVMDAVEMEGSPGGESGDASTTGESLGTVLEVQGRFNTLLAALEAANLLQTLDDDAFGPFTMLAPTDDAFATMPPGVVESWLADPASDLAEILLNHVLDGTFSADDLAAFQTIVTSLGSSIEVTVTEDGYLLNESILIIDPDVPAANHVIHVIDGVLLPQDTSAPGVTEEGAKAEVETDETVSPAEDGKADIYVVQPGDTLYGIAETYGVSWKAIAQVNGIANPNKIYAGQELIIPSGDGDIQAVYTVRSGDTLYKISLHYSGVTWEDIAEANALQDPNLIFPGDKLLIPTSANGW